MDLSIIIPLLNEEESLLELYEQISNVLKDFTIDYEIIFVDDGSTDKSWDVIGKLNNSDSKVKGIKFRCNYGKSAALYSGFELAEGNVVITMDADLQDNPEEIPELYRMIVEDGYDLVSGWKKIRHDPLGKTIPSKFFNFTARFVSGIKLHDFNCGLKSYRKEVIKDIEVYGEMHRYIPILAKRNGFTKIGEKVVVHKKRLYGVSKFGIERFIKGFLDLLSVSFISKFGKRPMHLFGGIGTFMFAIGFISAFVLGARKLWYVANSIKAPLVTENPYFYIALTAMILGTQMFLAGFLAELVSRNHPERNKYSIEKRI